MTVTFEDLAKFGVVNKPLAEYEDFEEIDLEDSEFQELADFLEENEIVPPEVPSEDYVADLNLFLEHSSILKSDLNLGDYIAQWGVLGMKWGRRKDRNGKYRITPGKMAGNHPGQDAYDYEDSVTTQTKGSPEVKVGDRTRDSSGRRGRVSKVGASRKLENGDTDVDVTIEYEKPKPAPERPRMTDAELTAVINRLRLEQQYAQLTAKPPNKFLEATKDVLTKAAKKQAEAYATEYLGLGIATALKKAGVPNAKAIAAAKEAAEKDKKDKKD